jgi:hypothetical protein
MRMASSWLEVISCCPSGLNATVSNGTGPVKTTGSAPPSVQIRTVSWLVVAISRPSALTATVWLPPT